MTSLVAVILATSAIAGYNIECNKWHPTIDRYQPGFTIDDGFWNAVPWAPGDHGLTQAQVEFFASRAVQAWARYGNTYQMPWIIGTDATNNGFFNDGVSAITHEPCQPWQGCQIATPITRGWTIAATYCWLKYIGPPNPQPYGWFKSDCDIVFYEDTPLQGVDGLVTWETGDIQASGRTGGPTGWDADFHRTLTHEIGHTLGLDHPDAPTPSNTCSLPADLDKCNADADSDDGPIMCAFADRIQTDVPTADDQNGIASLYGLLAGTVQFRYLLANGSSSNELYWDSYYNGPGSVATLAEPRISCTTDPVYGPDCAVANTTTDGNKRVQLNTFFGSSSLHSITNRQYVLTMNNSSIRAVDIAFRHRAGSANEAVAAYRDTANSNVVWLARWRPLDGTIYQVNTGVITQVEPRVAYDENGGSYFAIVVDRQRQMHLFVSVSDATAWWHYTLTDSAGTADGLGRTFMPVGLVCDSHSNAVPPPRQTLPVCRLVYSPYARAAQYKSGRFRQCEVRYYTTTPYHRLANCIDTEVAGSEVVDLADYGEGVPAGWTAGPQWLLSYSVPTANSDNNTGAIMMDNDSQFRLPVVDGESGDHPRGCFGNHMYGGWSLDWCEYIDRFVAVEKWGCL